MNETFSNECFSWRSLCYRIAYKNRRILAIIILVLPRLHSFLAGTVDITLDYSSNVKRSLKRKTVVSKYSTLAGTEINVAKAENNGDSE